MAFFTIGCKCHNHIIALFTDSLWEVLREFEELKEAKADPEKTVDLKEYIESLEEVNPDSRNSMTMKTTVGRTIQLTD